MALSLYDEVKSMPSVKEEAVRKLTVLRKETVGDQALVAQKLLVTNIVQEKALGVMADELYDTKIEVGGLKTN